MKVSLIQMKVMNTPSENLIKIRSLVNEALSQGGELVVLPEMCCCEYSNEAFIKNAMPQSDDFIKALSDIAKDSRIILVAGSVPESDGGKIYNTSFVFDENGRIIAKHRKVHLFDIDVKNGISFRESAVFSAGDSFTAFETKWGKIGLIICFDIRFPDFIKANAEELKMIIVPASFNMTTGPMHWELLFRARAVDNQLFMLGCASALDENAHYHSYGHSTIVDPWGNVITGLGFDEQVITCDIDLNETDEMRKQIPVY